MAVGNKYLHDDCSSVVLFIVMYHLSHELERFFFFFLNGERVHQMKDKLQNEIVSEFGV
jgi:hypothetical protein